MTDLLKDVLHEHADPLSGPHVDLDAIVRSGDRRVRRVRLTTGLAAAAVAAVVLGAGSTVTGVLDRAEPPVAGTPSPFLERHVGYATGDTIHWGTRTFTVSGTVVSYLQTDDGFVYTTKDKAVWLFDGTDAQRIGRASNNALRADDSGSLVAWVDKAEDGHPQYVVFDTHSRTEQARVDDHEAGAGINADDGGSFVYALDDGKVYWRTAEGITRYDVGTGDSRLLSGIQPSGDAENPRGLPRAVVDVAHGTIAYTVTGLDGDRMLVGPAIGDGAKQMPMGWNGVLSPDGRYLGVEDSDRLGLYDTGTAKDVSPAALDRYPYKVVYGWADTDTAMVFAIKDLDAEPYDFDLLSCQVAEGSCQVVLSDRTPHDGESFVPPVGDPMT